jgi:cytochrome c-type biogenesis protein CcmH/NrfF
MNGWLMWGLVLPVLLVVAGIVTIRRRKRRRGPGFINE